MIEEPQTLEPKAPPIVRVGAAGPVQPEAGGGKPPKWADELVRLLADSGTGAEKLAVIAKARAARFDDPAHAKLPKDDPKRHLTAEEGLKALEDAGDAVGPLTLDKARQFVRAGKFVPAVVGPVPADAHVPAAPGSTADLPPRPDEPAPKADKAEGKAAKADKGAARAAADAAHKPGVGAHKADDAGPHAPGVGAHKPHDAGPHAPGVGAHKPHDGHK